MKVAITSLYLPGASKIGVGYQVHALANALVNRGHKVTVFSACPAGENANYSAVVVQTDRTRFRTFGFALDLRTIDFAPFDILNAHGDDWFLWGVERPRHIHTFHGSCLAEAIHATTWAGRARMAALALCETQTLMLADDTIAVSANTRRYIPGIQHVIPCGVDTNAFRPGTKSAHPSILFVGTLHGRKRGRFLVDLFRSMIQKRLPDAQLWCVCDPPVGETDNDRVCWLGRLSQERLTERFRSAWVFCLPSTYEGFGVPYAEAMASGTPVVASPNDGSVEVTEQGRSGRIVSDAQLGATLLELLTDKSERERLIAAGLERSASFSWNTVCSQYEAIYAGGHS
jgi:phosphatidylinositol alpha-mannosyltransferase